MKDIKHKEITSKGWTKISCAEKNEKIVGITRIGDKIICATSNGVYAIREVI